MMFRRNKYGAKRTVVDGIAFMSKREAEYYQKFKMLEGKGEIRKIELQPRFELQPTFKKNGKTFRSIVYVADFRITWKDGRVEIIDIKGHETYHFLIKQKLFEYKYPLLTLTLLK